MLSNHSKPGFYQHDRASFCLIDLKDPLLLPSLAENIGRALEHNFGMVTVGFDSKKELNDWAISTECPAIYQSRHIPDSRLVCFVDYQVWKHLTCKDKKAIALWASIAAKHIEPSAEAVTPSLALMNSEKARNIDIIVAAQLGYRALVNSLFGWAGGFVKAKHPDAGWFKRFSLVQRYLSFPDINKRVDFIMTLKHLSKRSGK